jgi:hypothetical protein
MTLTNKKEKAHDLEPVVLDYNFHYKENLHLGQIIDNQIFGSFPI